jgi:hypothetical protein
MKALHWLPMKQRIQYKVNVMTFKALCGLSPAYVSDLIDPHVPKHYSLRLADQRLLSTPLFNLKSYMDLVLLNFKKPLFGTPYFLLYDRNHP